MSLPALSSYTTSFIFACRIIATIATIQNAEGKCGLDYSCGNGGKCAEDSEKCECRPGTSGDLCQIVDECELRSKCGRNRNIQCIYDVEQEKAVCKCKNENSVFDEKQMRCRSCDCGPHGKCHFDEGKKICDCDPGFSNNGGTCEGCDCGPHGKCHFERWEKICECDPGFSENAGICEGVCGFNSSCKNGGKCVEDKCKCKPRTSGEFCQIVDECKCRWQCGRGQNVQCIYDVEKEKAICKCKDRNHLFDEKELRCREPCEDDKYCWNGGECRNNFCECLPGTSGDDCNIIDACSTDALLRMECGDTKNVHCHFNETTLKHYCHCSIYEYLYDTSDRSCKECYCGENGNCSFVKGNKTCHCEHGYAVNAFHHRWQTGICEECKCGEHGDGCEWTSYASKKCYCHEGYETWNDEVCARCDCGPHGKCHFDGWNKICDCDPGFSNNGGTCEANNA